MGGMMSSLRGSPAPSSPSHVNQYYTASHCATHTQDIHLTLTISTSVPPVETTKNPAHQAASSAQSESQTQAQTQTGPERREFQGQEMNNSASSGNENSHGEPFLERDTSFAGANWEAPMPGNPRHRAPAAIARWADS